LLDIIFLGLKIGRCMNRPVERAIVILGPTASGKTRLAVQLANILNGEIISVDSRQVYRGLDIGSGKDIQEYGNTRFHLIDVIEPLQEYNLYDYLKDVQGALKLIRERKRLPVFAGGTGMYLDAILQSYRLFSVPVNQLLRERLKYATQQELVARLASLKSLHNATDCEDRDRTIRAIEIAVAEHSGHGEFVQICLRPYVIGIACSGDQLRKRIVARLENRLAEGMIEEVVALTERGVSWQKLYDFGLEYRYVSWYLQGELNSNDMQQKLASAIYQFARQQLKWFRRMERKGVTIHWLNCDQLQAESIEKECRNVTEWLEC
jgi:tRNA dimethylallyltransferase